MSDIMNLMEKIPYAIMLLLGIWVVVQIYVTGNLAVAIDIDNTQKAEYRKAVVLENLLSVDATEEELEATTGTKYSYDRRRAVMPIEFFTNKNPGPDEIGYYVTPSGHCYIDNVAGLDGENFGFYVTLDYSMAVKASNPRRLGCTAAKGSQDIYSEAMLVREARQNPLLPVKVHVYEIS